MDCVKLMESLSLLNNNSSQGSPTFYKSVCVNINNTETEIVYADHVDKLFIVISQYQKLGALLTIKKDQVQGLDNSGEVVYTVTPCFGGEDLARQAAARYIAEILDIDKQICMFICLKDYNKETVKEVTAVLKEIKETNK